MGQMAKNAIIVNGTHVFMAMGALMVAYLGYELLSARNAGLGTRAEELRAQAATEYLGVYHLEEVAWGCEGATPDPGTEVEAQDHLAVVTRVLDPHTLSLVGVRCADEAACRAEVEAGISPAGLPAPGRMHMESGSLFDVELAEATAEYLRGDLWIAYQEDHGGELRDADSIQTTAIVDDQRRCVAIRRETLVRRPADGQLIIERTLRSPGVEEHCDVPTSAETCQLRVVETFRRLAEPPAAP